MKKFLTKIFVGFAFVAAFIGLSAVASPTAKAGTRSVSFVIGKSITRGNPILNSRIVIADAYGNQQSTTGQNVPYQAARSFRVQTGRSYNVVIEGRYQVAGFISVPFGRHVKTVYVPHGARVVYIE